MRQLTLNETFDEFGRLIQMEGTNKATTLLPPPPPGQADFSRTFADAPTEIAQGDATEVWQIVNLTGDVHPIHIHLGNGQIMSRRPFDMGTYLNTPVGQTATLLYIGQPRGPDPTELGWKETFKMFPGEVTTFIVKWALPKTPFSVPFSPYLQTFGIKGFNYVWHCHILEHEEHDMMRPLAILPTTKGKKIIDVGQAGTSKTGTWLASVSPNPYGASSLYSWGGATYKWLFTPTDTGTYRVSMWWTAMASRNTTVSVKITYSGGTASVSVNQTQNGGMWNALGDFTLNAGTTYSVTVIAQPPSSPPSTCADAVMWEQL